jgi:hypothetical protein
MNLPPNIAAVEVEKDFSPIEIRAVVHIVKSPSFWMRLRTASRLFWYVISGRLDYSVMAKFKR